MYKQFSSFSVASLLQNEFVLYLAHKWKHQHPSKFGGMLKTPGSYSMDVLMLLVSKPAVWLGEGSRPYHSMNKSGKLGDTLTPRGKIPELSLEEPASSSLLLSAG